MSAQGQRINQISMKAITACFGYPTYPEFGVQVKDTGIPAGPWFCEDDHGRIAFVSEEAREDFMSLRWLEGKRNDA